MNAARDWYFRYHHDLNAALAGALPETDRMLEGVPPAHDDLAHDMRLWANEHLMTPKHPGIPMPTALTNALSFLRRSQCQEAVVRLRQVCDEITEAEPRRPEILRRATIYLSYMGDESARLALFQYLHTWCGTAHVSAAHRAAFVLGMMDAEPRLYRKGLAEEVMQRGMGLVGNLSSVLDVVRETTNDIAEETEAAVSIARTLRDRAQGKGTSKRVQRQVEQMLEGHEVPAKARRKGVRIVDDKDTTLDPREEAAKSEAELFRLDDASLDNLDLGLVDEPVAAEAPHRPGHAAAVVLRQIGGTQMNQGAKEASREFSAIAGLPLPLVSVPDLAAARAELVEEFPHLGPAVDTLLRDQSGRKWIAWQPTVIVGDPGAGKTRFVRRVAEVLGVAMMRFNCDGAADNSFAGTPRRWSTGGMSVPLDAVVKNKIANPLLHLDEIEKGSGSRQSNGGRLHDALIGFFERESAERYRDPYAEAECDLSHVLYLATANTLDGVPTPVLDRMRIVRVEQPSAHNLDALAPRIAAEAMKRQGLDARWGLLDPVEMGVLRRNWRGGSVRQLAKMVEAILAARDSSLPRQ